MFPSQSTGDSSRNPLHCGLSESDSGSEEGSSETLGSLPVESTSFSPFVSLSPRTTTSRGIMSDLGGGTGETSPSSDSEISHHNNKFEGHQHFKQTEFPDISMVN